jgi:hypothetical protein
MKRRRTRNGMLKLAILSMTALPAFAQGPGWSAVSTVVQVVNTSNGGVNVRLSPDLTDCISQSGYGSNFASIYPTHPGINRLKADLLVALTTGTKVMLYLSDNTCTVTEMRLGGL